MRRIRAGRRVPSAEEQAVVAAILRSSADARAELFLKQFEQGPLDRSSAGRAVTVSLRQTTGDLLVDLDHDVLSEAIRLRNEFDGGALEFRVSLRSGGFFGSLMGRADGPWPRRWRVDAEALAGASIGALTFVPEELGDPQVLADILRIPVDAAAKVGRHAPAESEELDRLEKRDSSHLPEGCRELLLISDGLSAGVTSVLGSKDLYVVDLGADRQWWLVGVDHAGTQIVCGDHGVLAFPEPRADLRESRTVASTYLEWVRALVG